MRFDRLLQAEILKELYLKYPNSHDFSCDNKDVFDKYLCNLHYLQEKGVITECVIDVKGKYHIFATSITHKGMDYIDTLDFNEAIDNAILLLKQALKNTK